MQKLDQIAISVRSHRLLKVLMNENPQLEVIMQNSRNETEVLIGVKNWVKKAFGKNPAVSAYLKVKNPSREDFGKLCSKEYAIIRILDYINHAGIEYPDLNLRGETAYSNPFRLIWLAVQKGTGGAKPDFFIDMIELFRQLYKEPPPPPSPKKVQEWMDRYPDGLDPRIIELRRENRDRILSILIDKMDKGEVSSKKYSFAVNMNRSEKMKQALQWWDTDKFHLHFAIRSPELLNELLNYSLDPDTLKIMDQAQKAGIPFFVNLYYLSLLHVRVPYFAVGADLAIRSYVLYSQQLVNEFGHIVAWEKEDRVEPGKPNAAGWILPYHDNIHRRYPEVAILIPDSTGRACGGLCSSCQRMYNFQAGRLNFNLEKLKPKDSWPAKLQKLMNYFEYDSQLRDILITGGDAFMSSDHTLEHLLDEVLKMAIRKKEANKNRQNQKKLAEITRIRFGTRLPVYLPQRFGPDLIRILKTFRKNAEKAGISQFIIQTHFESAMEITPEAKKAISRLLSAGWMVTNQLVFTATASRRGHSIKLRKVLNDIGVLSYYTFTVKGYMENYQSFTPNSRMVQEQLEEKITGTIKPSVYQEITNLHKNPVKIPETIHTIRMRAKIPFLATDRNVLNLPGVGKSMTFRVIGITRYGRRILEFDHDHTRKHSPIITQMGKVIIIESKSIHEYLSQLEEMGENPKEYDGIYSYSMGQTEERIPVFNYPEVHSKFTEEFTNLKIE